MTLQETERITGLRRTLIRRYERFGFIRTTPQVDGGRTYTKEQVQTLLRVRLLRQLMISEGEIRKVQKGYYPLCDLIQCCLEVFEEAGDSEVVTPLKRVCEQILRNKETFHTLRAYSYLVQIQGMRDKGMYEEDGKWWLGYWGEAKPEPEYPERRFAARMIDMMLLWAILIGIVYVGFSVQPTLNLFGLTGMWALHTVFYILLDAACITLFATTPGKLVEGIHVYQENGDYLTWKSSLRRSFRAMVYGMGWNLPVWNLYCMFRSYAREQARMEGGYTHADTLEWEDAEWYEYHGSEFIVSDRSWLVIIGMMILLFGAWNRGCLPVYRGDITIRQFAENRNVYARYLDASPERELSTAGKWVKVHKPGLQDFDEEAAEPEYNYYYVPDKNRILQQLVYKEYYTGTETVQMNTKEMKTAVWAFLGTDEQVNWLNMWSVGRVIFEYSDNTHYEVLVGSMTIDYDLVLDGMKIEQVGDSWQISPRDPEKEGYYSATIKIVRESPKEETDDRTEAD